MTSNTYIPSLHTKKVSTKQDKKWDDAVAFFNNKDYQMVLPTLLEYVGKDLTTILKDGSYQIPHGSVVVNITQTEKELLVKCPFLDITDAKKVPLMRRLAEMCMSPLNLTNIVLEENLVYFTFSCPIDLCEPYKVYSVLREICYYADSYDDEFIEKFNAAHLQEPKITPFSNHLKEEAYINYQKIIDEGIQRFDSYMQTRQENNAWYTLNITFKQIEFYAEPQGYLRTVLEKAVDDIFDRNTPFQNRLLNGKESLKKLKSYTKEQFSEDLYQIETFIPYKYSGKKENIRENWEDIYEDAKELVSNSRHEDTVNLLLSSFYNLFYYNLIDEEISNPVTEAMAKASGLPWAQAAPILLQGMQAIMEETIFENDFGMDLSKIMGEQMQQSMALMQQMMANFKTN